MHIHGNLFDPNLQLDAAYAAAKAEAKAEAERTRKKLLGATAALAGELDSAADCVVRLSGDGRQDQQETQQDSQEPSGGNRQGEIAPPQTPAKPFSDWA
jgi:hypothetical protein